MRIRFAGIAGALVSFLALVAMASAEQAPNQLSPKDQAGWKLLFDGKTTKGWRSFKKEKFPAEGWVVEEGWLHWLNGEKVLEYECGSPEVKEAVAQSKFKNVADFGSKIQGHILLQDHHSEVWFRNLKIREL